jgi:hypothetical protein
MTCHDDQGYVNNEEQGNHRKKSDNLVHHLEDVKDRKSRTLCSQSAESVNKIKGAHV